MLEESSKPGPNLPFLLDLYYFLPQILLDSSSFVHAVHFYDSAEPLGMLFSSMFMQYVHLLPKLPPLEGALIPPEVMAPYYCPALQNPEYFLL